MCMKNLNIVLVLGQSDLAATISEEISSLHSINSSLPYSKIDGDTVLPSLSFLFCLNAIGPKDNVYEQDETEENTLFFTEKYEIQLRLTETRTGKYLDLTNFIFDPSEYSKSQGLCKQTAQLFKMFEFSRICLPADPTDHNYVVKALVRQAVSEGVEPASWIIQSICPLQFSC